MWGASLLSIVSLSCAAQTDWGHALGNSCAMAVVGRWIQVTGAAAAPVATRK